LATYVKPPPLSPPHSNGNFGDSVDLNKFFVAQVVPKKSATFGLPGDKENIVMLNANHSNMCRFDDSQEDQDNFKLV
jgi:hypothetical protein